MKYRTPSALVLAILFVTGSAFTALAQDASVVYLEGEPELRTSSGATEWLDFGTSMVAGDSVVTGRNDFVELEQGEAASIRVEPNTVFTIKEVERNGQREQVMSTSVGSVGFRFNRLAGRNEPRIGTSSVVAGIRGTEVIVYAGANGSSLFLVETGEVAVTSAGQTVSLTENEGVEVPAGGPPGEKFSLPDAPIDFQVWNNEKTDEFLQAPAQTVQNTTVTLNSFIDEIHRIEPIYEDYATDLAEIRTQIPELRQTRTEEEMQQLNEETVLPLQFNTGMAYLNLRYNAISALNLRRFVLGKMYTEMKSRYILNRNAPEYREFIEAYEAFLSEYFQQVVPILGEADF